MERGGYVAAGSSFHVEVAIYLLKQLHGIDRISVIVGGGKVFLSFDVSHHVGATAKAERASDPTKIQNLR